MKTVNKSLLIISLVASFSQLPILAMKTDETESFYIQTADGEIHTITTDTQIVAEIRQYDIFSKATGTGKNQDDPKVLADVESLKPFQLTLLEQTEIFYIQPFYSEEVIKIPVVSFLLHMSEFFERTLEQKAMAQFGITEEKPLIFKQIDSEQLKLIIETIKNIKTLPTNLADKNIN